MSYSFFLGANSSRGFFSFYDELIDLKKAKAVYILKGCPGCGKSSLMKKIVAAAEKKGLGVERIYCSSDPDSLDGIILPELSTAVVDGTAPHVVEPSFPLAVESYVDLGRFADKASLQALKSEIISTKEKHASCFKHVYRFTACAGKLDNELFDIALSGCSIEKIRKKAERIISAEIPKSKGCGTAKKRFLSAISPKGYLTLPLHDDLKLYALEDTYALGHFLLSPISDAAEKSGLSIIKCYNPLIPERLEHLFIPELKLAFVTKSSDTITGNEYYKKIRIDSMILPEALRANKKRLSAIKHLKTEMLSASCSALSEAKSIHDELENIYNPYIDFEELYSFADELIEKIV